MRRIALFLALLGCLLAIVLPSAFAGAVGPDRVTRVQGTIWVANRGADTIRGFDAETGEVVNTIAMTPGSQPGGRHRAWRRDQETPPPPWRVEGMPS